MSLTESQTDFCAGLSLLYMASEGLADDYIQRMQLAMVSGDDFEAEHVAALMLGFLHVREDPNYRKLANRWNQEFVYARRKVMETAAGREMPKYQSHKQVWALEPLPDGGLRITPEEEGYAAFDVDKQFVPLHDPARPSIGWYYVVYEDGYKSFSPAEPFEEGYTRIS